LKGETHERSHRPHDHERPRPRPGRRGRRAVSFIVGNNVVVLQVAPPGAKPISVVKPSKAMAKTIAAKLA